MRRKSLIKIAFVCIALLLVMIILYSGLQILESTVLYLEPERWVADSKTIERDGVKYFPRQDITVVMILGINRNGQVEPMPFNEGGAADMITLMIFDERDETYSLLSINRDSMIEIPVLTETGKIDGTYFGQAGYAHTYGTGMEDSCENTRMAISNFLYGIQIDHYVALSMDAIGILNDAVGGVTVTIEDDFTHIDPEMVKGKVKLTGKQAVTFVQSRMNVGDTLNLSRIRRQQEYMDAFVKLLDEQMTADSAFVVRTFEELSGYIVTDCSANVISGIADRYGHYTMKENVTPAGENKQGEYMEYYVDQQALDELVLRMFYAPKA